MRDATNQRHQVSSAITRNRKVNCRLQARTLTRACFKAVKTGKIFERNILMFRYSPSTQRGVVPASPSENNLQHEYAAINKTNNKQKQ
jgi:hypothetical protein